ncbi:hypothetical protein [Parvibaculum sp.]|uniref:O-antigen ligase family protein n=1 Tax=Parvibaculum sp. TaxID=2024848 RepID=UPI001E17D20B|nr:hypothetical protein [Parvibaculum sp.]MBX3489206.1 hypothetical protein [Parvibaculum sp.]
MTVTDARTRRHAAPALRRVRQGGLAVAWPLALLTLSLFVPAQFYVDIGSFRLSAYRIVLFLILPFVTARLLGGGVRFKSYDVAILLAALWMVLAMSINHGILQGFESGGIIAFETVLGYFVARVYFRDLQSIVDFVKLLVLCLIVSVPILLLEISAGRNLVSELSSMLSGHASEFIYQEKHFRLGLIRAQGPFAHPIHAGIFMIAMLPFAWLTAATLAKRVFVSGFLLAGAFASLSSAPWLGFFLQVGLLTFHSTCNRLRVKNPWMWFFVAFAILFVSLELASNRGAIMFLSTSFTLEAGTAYYRQLIWIFGTDVVMNNPLFGIGHHDWARPAWMYSSTVDTFWLLMAMTFGLPVALLLGYASIDIFRRVIKRSRNMDSKARTIALATLISILALILMAFTVHYWGSIFILFLLMLGLGGSVAAGALSTPTYENGRAARRIRQI